MRHGIRKLYLHFNFLDALHFFKVTVGKLDQYRGRHFMTCDVFETLPNLDGLNIVLPTEWWIDDIRQMGPRLFHEFVPCPRTLHRFIYERIAKELAIYGTVKVYGFMDSGEEQHFLNQREAAILSLKFTLAELDELYAECGGGIQIEVDSDSSENSQSTEATTASSSATWSTSLTSKTPPIKKEISRFPESQSDVFPPECHCEVPCHDTFFLINA
jgi:hypothetical protein